MKKIKLIAPLKRIVKNTKTDTEDPTFDDIFGHENAKRALTIAIAGRHNILLTGPPGTGKTLLATASKNLLPQMTISEQIASTKIHAISQNLTTPITARPFRSPHHTATATSIIGGGTSLRPGEISLAHNGILFLDEIPEFKREVLEALREPLENHHITISRNGASAKYPADFILIATANPCPCGYLGSSTKPCLCSASAVTQYRKKLSGPLMDRIDMNVRVAAESTSVLFKNTTNSKLSHTSAKKLIATALKYSKAVPNGRLNNRQLQESIALAPEAKSALDSAANRLSLSTRSYFRVLKVAKTIANLQDSNTITPIHIAEAIRYRLE